MNYDIFEEKVRELVDDRVAEWDEFDTYVHACWKYAPNPTPEDAANEVTGQFGVQGGNDSEEDKTRDEKYYDYKRGPGGQVKVKTTLDDGTVIEADSFEELEKLIQYRNPDLSL